MRQAWFDQVLFFESVDDQRDTTYVDRFQGHWQEVRDGVWRGRWSPPLLDLDATLRWCEQEAVDRAYVNALADEPNVFFSSERRMLIGKDQGFETFNADVVLGRSTLIAGLPQRKWDVEVVLDLGFANYDEGLENAKAAAATTSLCDRVTGEDDSARVHAFTTLQAPTEAMASAAAAHLGRCLVSWSPAGLWDEMSDVFRPTVEVIAPRLQRGWE